jgi:hypothetical protein
MMESNRQNGPTRTPSRAKRKVYPTFYAAVHDAWNRAVGGPGQGGHQFCRAPDWPYEAEEHVCFEFAGDLRVSLHAAGVMLSSDVGAIGARSLREPWPYLRPLTDDEKATLAKVTPIVTHDPATFEADDPTMRVSSTIEGIDMGGEEPVPIFVGRAPIEREPELEARWRDRLANAEAALYDGPEDVDEPVKPVRSWNRWISRVLGRKVF